MQMVLVYTYIFVISLEEEKKRYQIIYTLEVMKLSRYLNPERYGDM
jgi:hypothetical protein